MIHLSEFGVPARGWPGRGRAIARLVLEVIGGAAFLLALLAIAYVAIILAAAKAGAL